MDRIYFDAHATVGPRPRKHFRERWSTEHLLEDMDLTEIAGALVVHHVAKTYDPVYGNERLKTELAKAPDRLFGAWCIAPVGTPGFFGTGDEMVRAMESEDVRAVWIEPHGTVEGGFSLHPAVMGATFETLQHYRIPTMMSVGSNYYPGGWGRDDPFTLFHDILSRYPRLPLIIADHTWNLQQHIYPLMRLHDNLLLEISALQANRTMERYVAEFGDERLLFGTAMTARSPGAARAYLDYAQISDESKRRIAGENLRRLLKGQGPARPAPRLRTEDPVVADAREGRPLSALTIDAHSHVLHAGGQTAGTGMTMYDGGAEGVLEVADWSGVDRLAMMSWSGPTCTDAHEGNEIVWEAIRRFGDRIAGITVVDPSHMDPEEVLEEIWLRHVDQGFVGMKPYPQMALSYEDDRFNPWWEFGNEHRLFALMHVLGADHTGGVEGIGRLAERFPEMSWLIAHSGSTIAYAEEVAACIREHPNVYAEITYTWVPNRCVEFLVERAGEDNVVYGTDQPMRDPRPQMGWVAWADLPVGAKEKVLGLNFQRVLDRALTPSR